MSKKALLNDQIRNRLAALSYQEKVTESDIKKVIEEELNIKEIPSFTLYQSSDMQIGKKSGNEVINKIVPKQLDKREAINFMEDMNIYGDGHSLGGHIVVSLALKTKNFDDVRGLNDAPVNIYQMVQYDKVFQDHLRKQYGADFKTKIKEENLKKEV